MDIQHACLSKIIVDGELQPFIDARITEEFFDDLRHRRVFSIVMDHYRLHSKPPSTDAIQLAYPRYNFTEVYSEPTEYYLHQLQEKRKVFKSLTAIRDINTIFQNPESPTLGSDSETIMRRALQEMAHEIPQGVLGNFYGSIDEHLALLDYRATNPGLLGLSTGFPTIDKVTNGLQKQQLISIIGLPKSGKSSVALSFARTATLQGAKALYFTFEMTVGEQNDRLMSLLSGMDLNTILTGSHSKAQRALIEKSLNLHRALDDKMIFASNVGGSSTLSGVQSRIQDLHPDIVIVDGVYLMQDESSPAFPEGSSQALTALTRGFKRMAQRLNVPIVLSTQALDSRSKDGHLSLQSIGYSSSFAQDSDVIFGAQTEKITNTIKQFKVLGIRSGPRIDCWIRTDWSRGLIEEITAREAEKIKKAAESAAAPKLSNPGEEEDDD